MRAPSPVGPVSFNPAPEFEFVWLYSLKGLTGLPLDFKGFMNIVTPKGKTGFGGHDLHRSPRPCRRLSLDVGSMVFHKPHKPDLFLAVELWEHKFGNSDSTARRRGSRSGDRHRSPLLIRPVTIAMRWTTPCAVLMMAQGAAFSACRDQQHKMHDMWPYSLIDWGMVLDWVSLVVRWTHVVAGIAWIGSSFYFIALDASLKPEPAAGPAGQRRSLAGAWRRLLPDPEIHRGAGVPAAAPHLVQMGGLFHLDLRLHPAGAGVLRQSRPVSDRHLGRQHHAMGRGAARRVLAGGRLVRLRRTVPLLDRPGDRAAGTRRLRAAGADYLTATPTCSAAAVRSSRSAP